MKENDGYHENGWKTVVYKSLAYVAQKLKVYLIINHHKDPRVYPKEFKMQPRAYSLGIIFAYSNGKRYCLNLKWTETLKQAKIDLEQYLHYLLSDHKNRDKLINDLANDPETFEVIRMPDLITQIEKGKQIKIANLKGGIE